jgi:hypothetical protein
MILVGLAGPSGVGKATVAAYLFRRHNFVRYLQNVPATFVRDRVGDRIVVVDLRFDPEADYLRNGGGQVWLLQRPGYLTRAGDAYRGITPKAADRGLLNDGPIEALYNRVDKLLDDLAEQVQP